MASLRQKKKSPFWILRYKSPATGKWVDRATKFRHDNARQTRLAEKTRDEATARERRMHEDRSRSDWAQWVPAFIASQYENPRTRLRVEECWTALAEFFKQRKLTHPAMLLREHCFEYVDWRIKTPIGKKKAAKKNTAILELRILRQMMKEAVNRGYVDANPCSQLGIKLAPSRDGRNSPQKTLSGFAPNSTNRATAGCAGSVDEPGL